MRIALCGTLIAFLGATSGISNPCHGTPQNVASSHRSTEMTAERLYRLITEWNAEQGRAYIGDFYSRRFNNGQIPDKETLRMLAEIFVFYMKEPKRSSSQWQLPAEEFLIEALKDVPGQIKAQKAFWATAYAVAETYFSQPTPENAEKLIMALPARRLPNLDFEGEIRLDEYVIDFASGRKNFGILDRKIAQGDPYAVDICYRLLNITDGAGSETVLYDLGILINVNPRLFLQKVISYQPRSSDLEAMLGMVEEWGEIPEAGNDPVKFKEIHNQRIADRIKALKSVDDPDLAKLRDQCISKLQKGIIKRP